MHIFYICSILCSSDIIAAVTIVKFEEQPKLFSTILGEGLYNDAVAIILCQTMELFVKPGADGKVKHFQGTTPLLIVLNFIELTFFSVLIGVVFGVIPSLLTKHWRFLSHSAIIETSLLLCFAMCSYYVSELFDMSGIVTLLCCALVMSHYTWYNLSPQGKHVTSVTFQALGFLAEAAVFSFVGVSVPYYIDLVPYCVPFIIAEFFIVIIGRYTAIYLSYYLFACFPGAKENNLSFPQVTFISWAALIRGAIAFGLVAKVDKTYLEIRHQAKKPECYTREF